MEDAPSLVNAYVFIGLLLFYQAALVFWSFRRNAPAGLVFLVALVPHAGVPYLLYRERSRVKDNHIAGALTYLMLVVTAFVFLFWYPDAMDDDVPWALIHTMLFFAFLGLANLILAPFRE